MADITNAEKLFTNLNSYGQIHPQRYKYSFSGSDVRTYCYFPQRPDLMTSLDSVHTISISVHEAKGQVRALGYRGIKGLTRATRTIAGSLILTIINDHPLVSLMNQYSIMMFDSQEANNSELLGIRSDPIGWSIDKDDIGVGQYNNILAFSNRLSSLLPPFNLILEFVAEHAPWNLDNVNLTDEISTSPRVLYPAAGLMLSGIEIIDEGLVVSSNDLVTEITLSYVAKDYKPFSGNTFSTGNTEKITLSEITNREMDLINRLYPDKDNLSGQVLGGSSNFEN